MPPVHCGGPASNQLLCALSSACRWHSSSMAPARLCQDGGIRLLHIAAPLQNAPVRCNPLAVTRSALHPLPPAQGAAPRLPLQPPPRGGLVPGETCRASIAYMGCVENKNRRQAQVVLRLGCGLTAAAGRRTACRRSRVLSGGRAEQATCRCRCRRLPATARGSCCGSSPPMPGSGAREACQTPSHLSQPSGGLLLGCRAAAPLGCWAAGPLGCWAAGLLGWFVRLIGA
jgi:hypothetical protein